MAPVLSAQQQSELVAEARQLNDRNNRDGWRLAEIAFLLYESGMPQVEIARDGGYSRQHLNDVIRVWRRFGSTEYSVRPSWIEAFTRVRVGPDTEVALDAIAAADSITVGTAHQNRQVEVKAIAAQLTDLPPAEKVQLARELAQDRDFRLGSDADRAERGARIRESYGYQPSPTAPRPERDWDRECFSAINTIVNAETARREGKWEPSPMTQYGLHMLRQFLTRDMTLVDEDRLADQIGGMIGDIEEFLRRAS